MSKSAKSELYPMRVTPAMFDRGDVVKKIFMDNIQTPYVGVVTAIIPSTNKVEVQWPYGMGIEDPWDLMKVNPMLHPPVVQEDRAYKTYQNQKAKKYNDDYCENLSHYNVLNDYYKENLMPLFMMSANLYNKGLSKKEAFKKIVSKCDSKRIALNVLDKVYNDTLNLKKAGLIENDGELLDAEIKIAGTSDTGFEVTYKVGDEINSSRFESIRDAVSEFTKYQEFIQNLNDQETLSTVVAHVARARKEAMNRLGKVDKEFIDMLKEQTPDLEKKIKRYEFPKDKEAILSFHPEDQLGAIRIIQEDLGHGAEIYKDSNRKIIVYY